MGYSNETTHYGIPLPTGSDLTTPMDYNESMTDVDVAVFEAKTDSSSALTKAGQLETALDETNLTVSGIDGRLTEAEGTIVSQGQAITNLGNDIVDLGQDVEDAICSVVEETATAEYDHAVGEYFWYNNTLYITTVAISIDDTIVPNTNCDTVTVGTELVKLANATVGVSTTELVEALNGGVFVTNLVYKFGRMVTISCRYSREYGIPSSEYTVLTVPEGYRPVDNVIGVCDLIVGSYTSEKVGRFTIDTDGSIKVGYGIDVANVQNITFTISYLTS